MPGTGIHGYTGYTSNGQYISNGIIQSQPTAQDNMASIRNAASNFGSSVAHTISNSDVNSLAANMAGIAGTGDSDYADYLRRALDISANNTALSQNMAREQMAYQTESDATAMAWSAAEAAKNRDWQERLANTAHVREVQDLLKAGLNPILAANNGAYTGSGATGQGFSSSGAMGNVDTSASGLIGQLISTYINTASEAAIAGMYTDATRYQADMSYAMNKANIDANMLMQDKSITSNEKMNRLNSDTALSNANTAASASLGAASMTSGATIEASLNNMTASIIGSVLGNEGTHYTADRGQENNKMTNKVNKEIAGMKISSEEKQQLRNIVSNIYMDPYATSKQEINKRAGLGDVIDVINKAEHKLANRTEPIPKSSGRGK